MEYIIIAKEGDTARRYEVSDDEKLNLSICFFCFKTGRPANDIKPCLGRHSLLAHTVVQLRYTQSLSGPQQKRLQSLPAKRWDDGTQLYSICWNLVVQIASITEYRQYQILYAGGKFNNYRINRLSLSREDPINLVQKGFTKLQLWWKQATQMSKSQGNFCPMQPADQDINQQYRE